MQCKEQATSGDNCEDNESWSSSKREIKNLKTELEKVKEKMSELQKNYSELQREYEKLTNKQKSSTSWTLGWKKIRNSSVFIRKVEAEENGEGQQYIQDGCAGNIRRRQSIS